MLTFPLTIWALPSLFQAAHARRATMAPAKLYANSASVEARLITPTPTHIQWSTFLFCQILHCAILHIPQPLSLPAKPEAKRVSVVNELDANNILAAARTLFNFAKAPY